MARFQSPVGWRYRVLVDKHTTGPPLPGQVSMLDISRQVVWGTPGAWRYSDGPDEPKVDWLCDDREPLYDGQCFTLHPLSEYQDDDGTVLWWHVPIQEPPYVGSGPGFDERHADGTRTMCARLLGEGWLTHWSRIPQPELPLIDQRPSE